MSPTVSRTSCLSVSIPPTSSKVVSSSGDCTSNSPLPSLGIPPIPPSMEKGLCGRDAFAALLARRRRFASARRLELLVPVGASSGSGSGSGSGSAPVTSTHSPVSGSMVYERLIPCDRINSSRIPPNGSIPNGEIDAGSISPASTARSYSACRSSAAR